jgi:hypothetical protein
MRRECQHKAGDQRPREYMSFHVNSLRLDEPLAVRESRRVAVGWWCISDSRFTTSPDTATPEAAPLAQVAVYLAVWEQWLAISFQAPFCC